MVGSTNHLDKLDPGIAKRPSRFDRKYYFSNPDFDQRILYAKFWQGKLSDNKAIDFPDKLCDKIAEITNKFSFAYMQEAFVATLLAIAVRGGEDAASATREAHRWAGPEDPMARIPQERRVGRLDRRGGGEDPDLDRLELWVEMQKQVKILKEEMEEKARTVVHPALSSSSQQSLPSRPNKVVDVERLTNYRDELDALLHGRRSVRLGPDAEEGIGL
jgi:transitional endoplasmic reticulum ATPase